MKPSGIGGMAVMEGVMMKNKDQYAVAVRKPNNEIVVEKSTHKDFSDKVRLFKLPIFRGMLAFVDSMVIGVKVLNFSSSFFEEEETEKSKNSKKAAKKSEVVSDDDFEVEDVTVSHKDTIETIDSEGMKADTSKDKENDSNALLMILAVVLSLAISVALFMVLPVLLTNLLSKVIESRFLMALVEGLVRLTIFIGYVLLASQMREIKRVFMYHGAEHKTINCLENGFELTVENVKWQSRLHKRCGTSFMLLVILISLVFFMILPRFNLIGRVISRVLLVPFIAGVSYEFIRLAGKSEGKLVDILSKPGLWMQGLTTKEPDDDMIEVAIQSVSAVFDWKAFLDTADTEVAVTAEEAEAQNRKKAKAKFREKVNTVSTEVRNTSAKVSNEDEEDDEILKALDKYFDFGAGDSGKSAENRD